MLSKEITAFGKKITIACDGKCNKAWGLNNRLHKKVKGSKNDDDIYYFSDDEIPGDAPLNPGTYEGGHAKPTSKQDCLNKWCFRECERNFILSDLNSQEEIDNELNKFKKRVYNIKTSEGKD